MKVHQLIALLQVADPATTVEVLIEANWPRSSEIVGAIRRKDLPETRLAGPPGDILLVCQAQMGPIGSV
jgi:hypothetical protein